MQHENSTSPKLNAGNTDTRMLCVPLAHLAGERICLLAQLVFSVENVHINEAVHIAEHIRDEGSVETLTDAAGAKVTKARTMFVPRRVKHIAASWLSKAGALSKNVVRRN